MKFFAFFIKFWFIGFCRKKGCFILGAAFLCIFGGMDIEISFRYANNFYSFFAQSESSHILVGDIIDLESFEHNIDADKESCKEIINTNWRVKYREWKCKNIDQMYLKLTLFAD